ncbi:MAG: hypothetical protein SWY16_06245 [Cyanobacteriota bacterium]|nr:hypothetical protein [Cyanobacteriota bacterium]
MKPTDDLSIFTQASPQIGHGHAMRCRSLAQEGRRRGMNVGFVTEDPYTIDLLQSFGEEIVNPTVFDRLPRFVVRDFKTPNSPELVREEVARGSVVLLMDELGAARTEASLVVDALMTPTRSAQYESSSQTQYSYGLSYTPLHPQFIQNHRAATPGTTQPSRLFVSFGGSDPFSIAVRYLRALDDVGFRGPATIVAEGTAAGREAVEAIVGDWQQTQVLQNVRDMAFYMKDCDLVATKLGVTQLEAFCLGLGCVAIEPTPAHVNLQLDLTRAYDRWPMIDFGLVDRVDFGLAARKTVELLQSSPQLAQLGERGAQLVDGLGVRRILDQLVFLADR